MLEIVMISECGNLLFMVFGGAAPTLQGCHGQNHTLLLSQEAICDLYHSGSCLPIVDHQFYSVNVEFELLCGDAGKVKDSTSYQMVGYLIGSLVWGQVSDVFGRRWPMLITLLINGVIGVGSAFAPTLFLFTVLRTLVCIVFTGHLVISMVYFCEIFPSKHRLWLAFVLNWSPNLIIVAGIAWLCGDWRSFSLVINALCFVAAAIMWYCSESPHYLLRRGRVNDAMEAVKRIYRIDRAELDEKELERVFDKEREQLALIPKESFSFPHLFCTWKLAGYTWAVFLSYFSASLVNYALLFNMETMSGSVYVNTFFMGLFRLLINLCSAGADLSFEWLGRKTAHKFFCLYAGGTLIIALVADLMGLNNAWESVIRFMLLSTASMVCQMYAVVSVVCNEVFPTPIRNVAYAMTQLSESSATIVAPQLYQLSVLGSWVPLVVMIVLVFGDFLSFHFAIPESKGKPLADRMPEGEERVGVFRKKSKVSPPDSTITSGYSSPQHKLSFQQA
ncbi:unnamed protein product, partial [Mesorhabditis belari]|uniref:Major facilitator superfamily (MFS) profile domain-containing protein n=1 Tax=Mesorhabditis belari TaxID=2138241 RepID=A0AAF3FMD0_9BILA